MSDGKTMRGWKTFAKLHDNGKLVIVDAASILVVHGVGDTPGITSYGPSHSLLTLNMHGYVKEIYVDETPDEICVHLEALAKAGWGAKESEN